MTKMHYSPIFMLKAENYSTTKGAALGLAISCPTLELYYIFPSTACSNKALVGITTYRARAETSIASFEGKPDLLVIVKHECIVIKTALERTSW